ncbi:MAG: hypothetical protein QOK15_2289 [Nocardioidaceae bacterium]|nr:hypothetical protein [Nocardioidaceae bacterium]
MSTENAAPLTEPPVDGSEVETLVGSLERQRRIFAWKTGGLDSDGLRATTAASTMTLGGLVKHLTLVEADYFTWKLLGRDPGAPWNAIDWDADPDYEWRTAADDTPEELYAAYQETVARSRANLAEALADGDAGVPTKFSWPDGRTPSVRRMLVDMIEEYARHTGHADVLREAVDGVVGEDPPERS